MEPFNRQMRRSSSMNDLPGNSDISKVRDRKPNSFLQQLHASKQLAVLDLSTPAKNAKKLLPRKERNVVSTQRHPRHSLPLTLGPVHSALTRLKKEEDFSHELQHECEVMSTSALEKQWEGAMPSSSPVQICSPCQSPVFEGELMTSLSSSGSPSTLSSLQRQLIARTNTPSPVNSPTRSRNSFISRRAASPSLVRASPLDLLDLKRRRTSSDMEDSSPCLMPSKRPFHFCPSPCGSSPSSPLLFSAAPPSPRHVTRPFHFTDNTCAESNLIRKPFPSTRLTMSPPSGAFSAPDEVSSPMDTTTDFRPSESTWSYSGAFQSPLCNNGSVRPVGTTEDGSFSPMMVASPLPSVPVPVWPTPQAMGSQPSMGHNLNPNPLDRQMPVVSSAAFLSFPTAS